MQYEQQWKNKIELKKNKTIVKSAKKYALLFKTNMKKNYCIALKLFNIKKKNNK